MNFTSVWLRAAAFWGRRLRLLQKDFWKHVARGFLWKTFTALVVFQLYLLRTRRREQHRNGNKNMHLPLGRKHCHFYKRRKIWWLFLLMNCFLSWTLQLQMKRADTKPMLAGASFIPVKLRNGNKEPVVLGTLGAENRRRRSQAAPKSWPADLWAWAVARTRLYREASASWICSSWSLSALGYTGVTSQLD